MRRDIAERLKSNAQRAYEEGRLRESLAWRSCYLGVSCDPMFLLKHRGDLYAASVASHLGISFSEGSQIVARFDMRYSSMSERLAATHALVDELTED